jgi:hypothetical protein
MNLAILVLVMVLLLSGIREIAPYAKVEGDKARFIKILCIF